MSFLFLGPKFLFWVFFLSFFFVVKRKIVWFDFILASAVNPPQTVAEWRLLSRFPNLQAGHEDLFLFRFCFCLVAVPKRLRFRDLRLDSVSSRFASIFSSSSFCSVRFLFRFERLRVDKRWRTAISGDALERGRHKMRFVTEFYRVSEEFIRVTRLFDLLFFSRTRV